MGARPEGDGATIHLDESRRFLIVGDRRWPVVESEWHDFHIDPDDPTSTLPWPILFSTRRARVAFENGWALSVAYGTATHSDNYHHGGGSHQDPELVEEPTTVEAAIFHRDVMMSDPRSWVPADLLNSMLAFLISMPSDIERARELAGGVLAELLMKDAD